MEGEDDSDWLNSDDEGDNDKKHNSTMIERETQKVERKMYDEGYREGIGLGKEANIQNGFDEGFSIGSPIGKQLGLLIGSLNALESIVPSTNQELLQKVLTLRNKLNNLKLSVLVEPDWEAIEHERSHGGQIEQYVKPESVQERQKRENILAVCQKEVDNLVQQIIIPL